MSNFADLARDEAMDVQKEISDLKISLGVLGSESGELRNVANTLIAIAENHQKAIEELREAFERLADR